MSLQVFGKVTIVTGGVPVRAVSTTSNCNGIYIMPNPSNAGVVYVGTFGMVTSTGVNVARVLAKPTSATAGFDHFDPQSVFQDAFDLSTIYFDGTTGDSVFVAAVI